MRRSLRTGMQAWGLLVSGAFFFTVHSTLIDLQPNSLSGAVTSQPRIRIESVTATSAVVIVDIPEIKVNDAAANGVDFKRLLLRNFEMATSIGRPAVPVKNIAMIIPENATLDVKVLEAQSVMLTNILPYPALRPAAIREDRKNEEPPFVMDEEFYRSDDFYPAALASLSQVVKYRGINIGAVQIAPVQCNPVRKQVKVYTHLKLALTLRGAGNALAPVARQRPAIRSLLNNLTINARSLFSQPGIKEMCATNDADTAADVIIITRPELQAAADTLAIWHRMKGYGVKLAIANYTDYQAVQDTVHRFYQNTNPKPQYCLIIGDKLLVPFASFSDPSEGAMLTDNPYVCMDGGTDYVPEMARGRLSVSNAEQAMVVVRKIIDYEKEPPADTGFYRRLLSCAQFSDTEGSGPDGYEDRAFVKVCEDIKTYLETKGYSGQRIYCAYDWTNPQYWNNDSYAWGEALPDYLKRPNFAWDGSTEDVNAGINAGAFLVYHYDHGFSSGWSEPEFTTSTMQLSNGGLLPVVYSINCSSGDPGYGECFAEKMQRMANGGAVAIVASTAVTYSGNNDALLTGMIDATWPGIKFSNPYNRNPEIPDHVPIYTLGDIFDQGLMEMTITWTAWGDEMTYYSYHLFGDPTTSIWSGQPQDISVTHAAQLPMNAASFALSGLNVTSGVATLYDPQTAKMIGKANLSGATATIPITNPVQAQGSTVLTITSHNYRPYIATIPIGDAVAILSDRVPDKIAQTSPVALYLNTRLIASVDRTSDRPVVAALYDCSGRILRMTQLSAGGNRMRLTSSGLAAGVYILRLTVGPKQLLLRTENIME